MPEFADVLRSASDVGATSSSPEVLRLPVRDLLGVSDQAAQSLAALGIKTIFDLGSSNLFATARAVVRAHGPSSRFGEAPGDLLNDDTAVASPDRIADLPVERLRMLSSAQATSLADALDVTTIADMANWPPYRAARRMVGEIIASTADPEDVQAEELRPRFGQFPTERVYYGSLAMFHALGEAPPLQELTGPITLLPAVQNPSGLNRPAIGALLTFEQSWFAQGVTLGHLLHSLSLAPGEATRIAVIDWSRKTSAFSSETIGESEQLDTATSHARALSEVQQAVASDFQAGGSQASSSSTSTSHSDQSSGSSGLIASLSHSSSGSTTDQSASTTGSAESSSWSLGNRSVLGSLTQNVNDRTEQHSSSVRNRRATAVREVSQSEHESVSTRIVANYNHMHALNLQYYEVVQIYRVEARLHRADRCVFIPLQRLDFAGPAGFATVERFRGALMGAALNGRIASLLADDTTAVEVSPTHRVVFPGLRPDLVIGGVRGRTVARGAAARLADSGVVGPAAGSTTGSSSTNSDEPASAPLPGVSLWDTDAVARVARLVGRPLVRRGSDSLFVPDDTELIGISIGQVNVNAIRLDHVGSGPTDAQTFTVPADSGRVDFSRGLRFAELDSIHVTKADHAAVRGAMTLHCAYLGRRFTLPSIPIGLGPGLAPQRVAVFVSDQADRRAELQQHLQNNSDHYSRAVFRSLDSATLTFLLSGFRLNGRPLIDQVEPRPVTVAGNYIVLRAPLEDDEESGVIDNGQPLRWADLLVRRGLERQKSLDRRLIPIPTGGVFAEAVLGRSNSAEKLDITRFWNWQDSPIPLAPPDIAAVQTGTRATPEDLRPGQLGPPVLNVVNPTALPDPTPMSAILNSLAALNFRDMGGLAGTQGMVSNAELATLDAATAAGKLASDNIRTEAQKAVAMGQIAADIAKAVIAAQVTKGQAKAGSGVSREGAIINEAKKVDEAQGSESARGVGGAETAPSVPAVSEDSGNVADTEVMTGVADSNYSRAFHNLLDTNGGLAERALGVVLASAEADGQGGGGAASPRKAPKARKVKFTLTITRDGKPAGAVAFKVWEGDPLTKRIAAEPLTNSSGTRITDRTFTTTATVLTVWVQVRISGFNPNLPTPTKTFDQTFVIPISEDNAEIRIEVGMRPHVEDVDAPNEGEANVKVLDTLWRQGRITFDDAHLHQLGPGRFRGVVRYLTETLTLKSAGRVR